MNWRIIAMENEGLHTADSLSETMGIGRDTAILYVHEMRKRGFVKTIYGKNGKRLYRISPLRLRSIGSKGFIGVINENSRLKIEERYEHRLYERGVTKEESIIFALKSGNSRIMLASMNLFRKRLDWSALYRLARQKGFLRHVGALYELSRRFFRVRRADQRILRRMKESRGGKKYLVAKRESKDFKDIERKWQIYIPFNRTDMERLVA